MFQVQFRQDYIMEANTMNPALGPYCLNFKLRTQAEKKVMTGGKLVNVMLSLTALYIQYIVY